MLTCRLTQRTSFNGSPRTPARVTTPTAQPGSTPSDSYPTRSPALNCVHVGNTSLGASTPTATSLDEPPQHHPART
ncbi:hypothetical protein HMPREF9593_01507 [Cutibacterium acnes HL046PA2]|nr:hypothetical protein HMPREF9593_01507 [Cutibacterium acnes HL046PA2]EGF66594.1 hypothetical protein HMPREF9588_02307 [Cutibacterium acnes HL025PA2]MCQ8206935.1 hypothetical protein [Cutibacterium acnes subsp. acnes]